MADEEVGWFLSAHARELIRDLVDALRSGQMASYDDPRSLPRLIGEARASQGTHPVESIRAASDLFDVIMRASEKCPASDAGAIAFVARALNTSMSLRIGEAVASYYGFLLDKLHDAQADERGRLARELHDRVGGEVSIASRQLELYDLVGEADAVAAGNRVGRARGVLAAAMANIRQLTADLRGAKPIEGLEKNLRAFVDSAGAERGRTEMIVNGDEAWLVPSARDEVFLVLREALRNAFEHASAQTILLWIDIAPHELRATVQDDGAGFDPDAIPPARGQGIRSMTERVKLLGGTIRLSSVSGRGTKIEIHLPRADDAVAANLASRGHSRHGCRSAVLGAGR